ncbi:MAG: hypothetical protein U1F57_07785 [bacterium]
MKKILFHGVNLLFLASFFIGVSVLAAGIDDVPTYPQAMRLCQQHVSGQSAGKPMHILWRQEASSADVAKVVSFYEQKWGVKGAPGPNQSVNFVSPSDSGLTVTVFPRSQSKQFPSCEGAPTPSSSSTLILVSQALK